MNSLLGQIRFSIRHHLRRPVYSLFVIAFVGAGLGVGISVFSAFNALFLTPLPTPEPERLAVVFDTDTSGARIDRFSYPDYRKLRESNRSLRGLLAYAPARLEMEGDGESDLIEAAFVSDNYFSVLGLFPARGRFFEERGDDSSPGPPVAVVSEAFLRTRLGGADPVGRTIRLNGVETAIIGLAPAGFQGLDIGVSTDVWVPIRARSSLIQGEDMIGNVGAYWLHLAGLLKPDVGFASAGEDLGLILSEGEGSGRTRRAIQCESLRSGSLRRLRGFTVLLGLFGVLGVAALALVCLNLAQMTYAQALSRSSEIAVRASLGASPRQLYLQLLMEGGVLAAAAAVVGLAMTLWTRGFLLRLAPPAAGLVDLKLPLDYKVVVFAVVLSLAVGAASAVTPALRMRGLDLVSLLRSGLNQVRGSRSREVRLRKLLVTAQTALSVVLIASSALLLRSLANLNRDDFGFSTDRVAYLGFTVSAGPEDQDQGRQSLRSLLDRFSARGDVEAVSLSGQLPFSDRATTGFGVPGREVPAGEESMIDYSVVGPHYFKTVGVPLLEGRDFQRSDDRGSRFVAVVNETAAKRLWPNGSPLGATLHCLGRDWEVIATAGDAKQVALTEDARPHVFLPILQVYQPNAYLIVKTVPEPETLLPELRREIPGADPRLRPLRTLTFGDYVGNLLWGARVAAAVLAAFGAVTLLLALGGAYALTLLIAARRRGEMAVRIALGATSGDVLRMAGSDWLRMILPGLSSGLLAAVALAHLFSHTLYRVSPFDPVSHGIATIAVLAATAAASAAPAIQTARIDPAAALRNE